MPITFQLYLKMKFKHDFWSKILLYPNSDQNWIVLLSNYNQAVQTYNPIINTIQDG